MTSEERLIADYVACRTCGLPVAGGRGDWWHVAPGGGYGEMRGPDGHLASPGDTERDPDVTFRRTLDTGVIVEVDDNGTMLRLIDHDRTAEWTISSAEATALRDGLTLLLNDGSQEGRTDG